MESFLLEYFALMGLISVHRFHDGVGGEVEVDVGYYGGGGEGDTEAAVAGAADGQELAFDEAVGVGYAHAAAYQTAQGIGAGGVECDALAGGGGGDEVLHLAVAYDHGLTVGEAFHEEVFHADAALYYSVEMSDGVLYEEYVGDGGCCPFYAASSFNGHALFHRHEEL